ncbi:phosphoribosylformylglycinamidine cycl [Eremomyces bilateralis CBS 781.70]|uniref:phosphoribosylformylglycinamidine cyclo-ligase n=1 Tax=Eremomyces bilateralis CBS 781.70 TaxID=1392243 RepID=A0A6G1GE16_9PEZI|nr:phosphoribosylformylglycinamidine cycl [Eremomyces bilateralis CBS 781.70]KAF1816283.1 phosphoribosylformylglycinamidine cycl [Eremomyces bilateralis CBS 781.70]
MANTKPSDDTPLTYAASGVSISSGNDLVRLIKPIVASTAQPGTTSSIGGFGGVFSLHDAGFPGAPTLVSGIDGIGTKVKIAFALGKHDTVGIDLVAMNVNDLVVQGARPLFFLDYYACGELKVQDTVEFVRGVAEGCRQSGASLVGGETAEMPGVYTKGEYDAAGCAVGALPHGAKVLPDINSMRSEDVLLGLGSSGLHSNGFSLVRKIVERAGLNYSDPAPWDQSTTVGASLLTPTKIYVKSLLKAVDAGAIKGMAHITGGGLVENIPRMLPKTLEAVVDAASYPVPPEMQWLKKTGQIEDTEFARVWNTGIGMVLVVDSSDAKKTIKILEAEGEKVYTVGRLADRTSPDGCVVQNMSAWS